MSGINGKHCVFCGGPVSQYGCRPCGSTLAECEEDDTPEDSQETSKEIQNELKKREM